MKSAHAYEPHLVERQLTLLRGGEWTPSFSGWLFIGLASGTAYFMHPLRNLELGPGAALLLSEQFKGTIRCSLLGEAQCHFFRVDPGALAGIATLGEQRSLQLAASQEPAALRFLEPSHPVAEKFSALCKQGSSGSLAGRLKLLELFIHGLGTELKAGVKQALPSVDARARLEELLKSMPAAEFLRMEFMDLAGQLCCTPRHLSRTFHEVVGASFREKQTEFRLTRAKELLATTQAKVLDVALESGYQSLSLFNLMFKKHTGITPRRWREEVTKRKQISIPRRRVAPLQVRSDVQRG